MLWINLKEIYLIVQYSNVRQLWKGNFSYSNCSWKSYSWARCRDIEDKEAINTTSEGLDYVRETTLKTTERVNFRKL